MKNEELLCSVIAQPILHSKPFGKKLIGQTELFVPVLSSIRLGA